MQLRPYQINAVNNLRREVAAGNRRIVLQSPTGSGKTLIAAEMIRGAEAKGKKTVFLAPRRELVYQCSNKLTDMGILHGLIMAGEVPTPSANVQVCCVPTLHARAVRRNTIALPDADLVIADESHLFLAETFSGILDRYSDKVIIGLTATPARTDGRGLGEIFQTMVSTSSVKDLVNMGFLVPQTYFSPSRPDLEGIKIKRGDYAEDQLQARMNTPKLVGDIVTNWSRLASDRQTVVFASGVAHSIHLRDEFRLAGVAAEHLDGKTPTEERADILRRVNSGDVQVLTNCMVCTFGWDAPTVSCCVLARPTKSLTLYLQMAGRVLRPSAGKETALILDHSGAVQELGFVDEEQPWSLHGDGKIQERKAALKQGTPKPVTCPECKFTFKTASECPRCGWKPAQKKGAWQEVIEGDLYEVSKGKKQKHRVFTVAEKQSWYSQLCSHAKARGFKDGWIAHKYREKFGVWPRGLASVCAPVTLEVSSWIQSRNIARAKGLHKPIPMPSIFIDEGKLYSGTGREF